MFISVAMPQFSSLFFFFFFFLRGGNIILGEDLAPLVCTSSLFRALVRVYKEVLSTS